MNLRSIVAVSVVALAALACGPQESATDAGGSWVGTITTEGNVTTVVNESGSVWGGTARLVEEASIGARSRRAGSPIGTPRRGGRSLARRGGWERWGRCRSFMPRTAFVDQDVQDLVSSQRMK